MTIYAVYRGFNLIENKIIEKKTYSSWNDMKDYVIGISIKKHGVAPVYKKCNSVEEVESFFDEEDKKESLRNKSHLDFSLDTYHIYVDGSFSKEIEKYSSGIVILKGNIVLKQFGVLSNNSLHKEYYQIPGELKACMIGLKTVLEDIDKEAKEIIIYHDYEGVRKHATGEWDRDNDLSKSYYEWFQKFINKYSKTKIDFIKVDAHKGYEYNELADKLAKKAIQEEMNQLNFKKND